LPRIRSVKPSFWLDDDIAEWHPITRLIFIGLLTHCQDNGVGSANVRKLVSLILPMDEFDEASTNVRRALDECSRTGQIVVFEHEGRPLYWVRNFAKHQRVDKPGECPMPVPTQDQMASSGRREVPPAPRLTSDDEPRLSLVEDSTNVRRTILDQSAPGSGEERSGKGEEKKNRPAAARPAVQLPLTAEVVEVVTASVRPDVEALCTRLHEKLIENDYKPLPKITDAWRREARLLIDKDERNLDQALKLIVWALENEFWSTNIASMGKFRLQYPKLLSAAKREHAAQRPREAAPTVRSQRLAATAAMVARLREEEAAEQNGPGLPNFARRAIQA
jgi:hypothetical protein